MGDTIVIETPVATVLEVSGLQGPQGVPGATGATGATGPQGPAGTGIETLTTKGDLLSRNDSAAIRVGIGSTGQVLKVASSGLPAWENESGGVPTSRTISAGTGLTGGGDLSANRTLAVSFGSSAGTACEGNDARLSDARTPSSHAASHAAAGSDPLFDQNLNTTDPVQFTSVTTPDIFGLGALEALGTGSNFTRVLGDGGLEFGGTNAASARTNLGLAIGTDVAAASHAHGNLTNDGKLGSTSGLPVVTTTAGAVTTLALGTANQVLRVNSGATGVEFADPAAAGVTSVSGTAPIVSSGGTTPTISVTTGSTSGTVAAGDDSRITGAAQKSANLSDLASASTARTNLGLGTAATAATGDFAAASHSHELTALAATGATNGHVLTANGSNGVTFAALPASGVTGAASSASDVLGVSGANITGVDANADRIIFWDDSASALKHLTVGSGLSLTDTTLTATATGTIGGSTGATDNLILRSDGTGAATLQNSALQLDDATTSTQANVALINAHSETNSSLVLAPKGTGALIANKPNGLSSGGNARGSHAVDLQLQRSSASQVASGNNSVIIGGLNNTASGVQSIAVGGSGNTINGIRSASVAAESATVSGNRSVALGGTGCTVSNWDSVSIGAHVQCDRIGMLGLASGRFAAAGDAQHTFFILRNKTTTNSAVELFIGENTDTRLTIPSGKVLSMLINITGARSDGSAVAHYVRQYAIKNVGGTTSEVYAAATVGTDAAAGTSITLSANDTNDAVRIECTGIASQTWRWVASVDAVEVAYGT